MKTNPRNSPLEPSTKNNLLTKLVSFVRCPSTLIISGVLLIFGITTYCGISYFVFHKLSPILSKELSRLLEKDVKVGKIINFSFNKVSIGSSYILTAKIDPDYAKAEKVNITVNPLPILIGKSLIINVTFKKLDLFIKQNKTGEWIELPKIEEEREFNLPINIDVRVHLEDADIMLHPYGVKKFLFLEADGQVNYNYQSNDNQQFNYTFEVNALNSKINIEGKTNIKSWKTQVQLQVYQLGLVELVSLIPNLPITLKSGQLNSNLNLFFSSVEEIEKTTGLGEFNISNIEAYIKSLKRPLKLSLNLYFQGKTIQLEQTEISLGKLVTKISGKINWGQGYDIDIDINPVHLRDLLSIISLKLPLELKGEIRGKIKLNGGIKNPILTGIINNTQPLLIDRIIIKKITSSFYADLDQFLLKKVQIIPASGGNITARAKIELKSLKDRKNLYWQKIPFFSTFDIKLPIEKLATPYYRNKQDISLGYVTAKGLMTGTLEKPFSKIEWQSSNLINNSKEQISGKGKFVLSGLENFIQETTLRSAEGFITINSVVSLKDKKWTTNLKAYSFSLSPLLMLTCSVTICLNQIHNQPVTLGKSNVKLTGKFDNFNFTNINGQGSLTVNTNGGIIVANSYFMKNNINSTISISKISLNSYIPNLAVPIKVTKSHFNLSGPLDKLLEDLTLNVNYLQAKGSSQLTIDGSPVTATIDLGHGILRTVAKGGQISLSKIFPNLSVNTKLISSNFTLIGNIKSILGDKINLSSAELIANLQFSVNNDYINTTTRLHNHRWTININAYNLNSALILEKIIPKISSVKISNVNAKIKLSGNIEDLLEKDEIIPIQVNNIAVWADEQILNAQGNLQLSDFWKNPDITNVNLSVNVRSNLNQLASIMPLDKKFILEELSVAGQGEFIGKFVGKHLLTSPIYPGNLQLLGNLKLKNLVFNDQVFEEILTGTIKATIREKIALNLEGKEDKIAAILTTCTLKNCFAPYIPTSFELRKTAGEQSPIIVRGMLEGDLLTTKIEVLPLNSAKIALGRQYGFSDYLSGSVSGQLNINTSTYEGRGTIIIDEPGLGFIKGRQLTAKVHYKNNVAFLENASIKLEKSNYNVQGSLDLKSLALQGKLTVNDGRIEDLLTALNVTNIEYILDIIKSHPLDNATAEGIAPQSVGDAQTTIAEQVNLLGVIDKKIRQLAAIREVGGIPTILDIRGRFDTDIAFGGTLLNPTVNLDFIGNKWEWHPQRPFPDIVQPLGLVILDKQFVPINSVKIQAKLLNKEIKVKIAKIRLQETLFSLKGDFSPKTIDSKWRVQRLSVDTMGNFVQLPIDIGGFISISGTMSGTITQPKIQGKFAFLKGALQGQSLGKNLQGQFSYQDAQFRLATTNASFVYIAVNLPFPITPNNDTFNVETKLGTDALRLISILTGKQVILIDGDGQVNAKVQGRIDLFNGLTVNNLNVQGKILLKGAIFQSAALPEPLTISGEINLDDQAIKITRLQGTFAQSNLSITGILPLFESQPQIENPLTIAIEKGNINLEGLYSGEIEGDIFVMGNVLQPSVGGTVSLTNGQVFIPETPEITTGIPDITLTQLSKTRSKVDSHQKNTFFIPKLRDFRVIFQNLSVQTLPLFQFQFGGDLIVNGSLNNLNNLKPQGNILLNRGLINFLDTRFFIERRNSNQIIFYPDKGLFNPDLDLQLRTIVSEVAETSKDLRAADTTEITDDSLNKVQRVDINLAIKGSLTQLIPSLNKDESELCLIKNLLQPIRTETTWAEEELTVLENCLTFLAEQSQANLDEQLLSNPVINLTSSPPQSQGQIVRLLGKQIFILSETLQGQNTEQLIKFGIVQLGLSMIFQTIMYDMESVISEMIRSTDFRFVPFLETIYEVEDKGFVKFSYDYSINEFRIRYEKRF
ncbi:translocation/assembly module TamB domain-containing protein [Cyanobacterium sp. uoEpiScrs1]|uniref:translocation/assembly module TamB domain-containing protein n=1 Tax=Cyanobacterium sp. uoEpiScrs1 TaxID=2976343 RepID=UPI0022699632|nr:translocation/assembly module TamB domain-containing protein [Cyanobacterium sp. uoEpiScrs1]